MLYKFLKDKSKFNNHAYSPNEPVMNTDQKLTSNNNNSPPNNLKLKNVTAIMPNYENLDKFKDIFEQIEKYRKNESGGKLTYSFWDVFGIRLCCCLSKYKQNKKFYEIGDRKLNHYVDYLEVITLLQEFNKLKRIILDKDRLEIFKYTKKQNIVVNKDGEEVKIISDNNQIMSKTFIEKSKEKDAEEEVYKEVDYLQLFKKYRMIKIDDKMDFDQRLIDDFDNDIKMPFDIIIEKL